MNILSSIFFLLFLVNYVTCQSIVIVDQENNVLTSDFDYQVKLTLDKATIIEINTINSIINVPVLKCDSLIELQIEGPRIKTYYNQYYLHQFKKVDTIMVSDRKIIKGQTPRLLLGNSQINDSFYDEQMWFKEWCIENNDAINGISFLVNSTERLTDKQRKLVEEAISKYCVLIDKIEFSNNVTFVNDCYVSGQEDLFNEGTLITQQFIDNQNTIEMRQKAEKYSIVVTVLIDWKR